MLTHRGTETLHTPRLTLRRITEDDAPAMFRNWASDERTARFMTWAPHPDVDCSRNYIAECVANYESPTYYHWIIELESDPVGTIGLHNVSDQAWRCELGYCIGSQWWNRGIVTEATGEVLRFAFAEVGMHKVLALHDVENGASGRVMEKNGMVCEGLLRLHARRRDGTFSDMKVYGILDKEWRNQHALTH